MNKKIIVTGGLGYIGSHVCLELIKSGHTPIVIDCMENSKLLPTWLFEIPIQFHRVDMRSHANLKNALNVIDYDGVIHTAGYKNAEESVIRPQKYFRNNIGSTINLVDLCHKPIVFSSSASVYGDQKELSVKEDSITRPKTPYGYSKLTAEELFYGMDSVVILRYFNVIGNDDYRILGEHKNPEVKNVLQHLFKNALNKETFTINGNEYNTIDGTPVRDFIDVTDLAKAHVKAIEKAIKVDLGVKIYNAGSGSGVTILELTKVVDNLIGVKYETGTSKNIDIDRSVANIDLIREELGWQPQTSVEESVASAWKRFKHVNK